MYSEALGAGAVPIYGGCFDEVRFFRDQDIKDKEEASGGIVASWKGCFVGRRYLVEAVALGSPGEKLYGNFLD